MENYHSDCLKDQVKGDLLAHDFLTNAFVSAALSYRHDTVLRPFPPSYLDAGKNFDALRKDISKLDKMEKFVSANYTDANILQLLTWLYSKKRFSLRTCDLSEISEILNKTKQTFQAPAPTYIFEVQHCSSSQEKFHELIGSRNVIYAYHGSKLENFYSILYNGLRNNLCKNALFGEGTYLSSELSVSLDYSPFGHGWCNSILGDKLSCVAICEIIEDEAVKCKIQDGSTTRRRVKGSLGGDVPEKYYVVTNDDLLRVKYILVYATKETLLKKHASCFVRHKFVIMIFSYFLLLIFIWFYNSGFFGAPMLRRHLK